MTDAPNRPQGPSCACGREELTVPAAASRWERLRFRPPPPSDAAEPEQPVLVEYVSGGRVAVVTLNRPHADNAITTELAASLIEILETIAARPGVRVAILTGAGERAFSIGGDLRQRKEMTKEGWLRQRQVFDRVLYTLRQLRKPIFAAVHGMAVRRRLRDRPEHRLHHRVRGRAVRPARSGGRPLRGRRLAGLPSPLPPSGEGHADADDR